MGRNLLLIGLLGLLVACENKLKNLTPIEQFPAYILEGMDDSVVKHLNELVVAINDSQDESHQMQFVAWKKFANASHTYEIFQVAEMAYQNALLFELNEEVVNYQLGHLYRLQSKFDQSNESFNKVTEINDEYAPVFNNLAENYFDQGNLEAAEKAVLNSLSLKADEPYALNIYANILSQSGSIKPAIEALEKVVQIQPDASKLYFTLAQLLQQVGNTDEATVARSKAGDGAIKTSDLWLSEVTEEARGYNHFISKAELYLNRGDYKTALYWADKANDDRPNGFTIQMFMGVLNVRLGKLNEAMEYFTHAHQQRPDDVKVNVNLGTVYKEQGKYKQSIKHYQRALELDNNHLSAQVNLADSYCFNKQYKDSLDLINGLKDSAYHQQALYVGLKCQVHLKKFNHAYQFVKDNIASAGNNDSFIEYAILLLATTPIDEHRDGKRALAWLEKIMRKQATNKRKQLLVMALMSDQRFDEAQKVLSSMKSSKDLFIPNQNLHYLINNKMAYLMNEY